MTKNRRFHCLDALYNSIDIDLNTMTKNGRFHCLDALYNSIDIDYETFSDEVPEFLNFHFGP
jgi:hypothetical protein